VPEGDTIHKIADYLAPRLKGRAVRRLRMADPAGADRCTGRRIEAVFAHGKHLFLEFDNDLLLRSHLGMYGDWHRYRAGEPWRRPRWQASLELAVDEDVFVCFNAKEIELLRAPSVRERILGTRLGPDLVEATVDTGRIVLRAREFLPGETLLADVLLDQRIAAGIGNVYKSEVLFIEGCLPQTPLAAVSDEWLAGCFTTAAELLRRNLGGGPRVTRFVNDAAGRLWVYGRRGKPCLRCEGRIASARLGRDHRSTYWCMTCQS
jgi:endonuclease-8